MADMDQQPREDLSGAEARKKIHEIGKNARMCMFATDVTQYPGDVRPMAIQKVEEDGSFWFLSSSQSEKNRDIAKDKRVVLTIQNDDKYDYLAVSGTATVHTDRATIDKYWTSFANAWFEGKDDPRITVIRVTPDDGHYWQSESGKIVSFIKMSFSAVTGSKTSDGGVDGDLKM